MTNIDKAIELLVDARDDLNIRSEWPHAPAKIDEALALLREKPERTELGKKPKRHLPDELRLIVQEDYTCQGGFLWNGVILNSAADLLDQQAQEIDRLTHLVADLRGELGKSQEAINAVSSPDASTMDINSPCGTKVVFAYPNAGYEAQRFLARRYLTVGQTYTVERTEISQTSTRVYLKEVPGQSFNSVMFAPAKEVECST